MKRHLLCTALLLPLAASPALATEQLLLNWDQVWQYFQPMSDDPSVNEAGIPDAGGGAAPNDGPDLVHSGFNSGPGAWFAPQAQFNSATGYATVFGKGFNIDGALTGVATNYSTYDGGQGPGPFGYGAIAYFGVGGAELLGFGTTLTLTPENRKWASYYRTTFTATQEYTRPRVRLLLDDNAIIFVDGVLVARVNRNADTLGYTDTGGSDTDANNNETGSSAGNENVIQSFRLDQAGGPNSVVTPGAAADSFVSNPLPKLASGTHTIAVIVRNSGGNSSDKVFGMQLYADDAGLSAEVHNITRTDGGTPGDVSDDTCTANIVVTAINLPGATGWNSDNPPANGPVSGLYAQPVGTYTYTFAAQANNGSPVNSLTINFSDSTTPAITTAVTITAPEAPNGAPLVLAPATPMFSTGFEEPPVATQNHNRKTYHTELGFTSNAGSGPDAPAGTTLPGGVYQDAIGEPGGDKSWRAVNGVCNFATEAIALDPSVKGVKVTMECRAFTTSGTSFETADAISLGVETSPDGIAWTLQGNVLPVLNGSPDATAQQNLDRIVNLLGPDLSSVNDGIYVTLSRETVPVGAGAAFVRLRFSSAADTSTSENILLDNLKIEIATIDPLADADGDGATNAAEEEWGSDMNSAFNRPGILNHSVAPGANPGELVQSIEIYSGNPFHSYTFRVSDDLQIWTDTTVNGIDDAQVFSDTSTNPHRFFQVRSNF